MHEKRVAEIKNKYISNRVFYSKSISAFVSSACIRGESNIIESDASSWRKQDDPSTPCHIRHSQNFDKIDSFLNPVLNIFILRNLIVWLGGRLLKRGLVFCILSIDLEEGLIVGRSTIHEAKSWYYLGPFQTFKVEIFAKICGFWQKVESSWSMTFVKENKKQFTAINTTSNKYLSQRYIRTSSSY